MKKHLIAILSIAVAMISWTDALAINAGEDIHKTISDLRNELQYTQQVADEELNILQDLRTRYWSRISDLQQEVDKAVLVLYSQDGGSLFTVSLTSETIGNICRDFNREKAPFEKWLQTMMTVSNRHSNIRKALERIHSEGLDAKTLADIDTSIAICDSLDSRFASLRDSIALDRNRYERLSAEIQKLEEVNSEVVTRIRQQIFQENNEDFITFFSTFNYSDLDAHYNVNSEMQRQKSDEGGVESLIRKWNRYTLLIALLLGVAMGIVLRIYLKKESVHRSKRWYYAFLAFLAVLMCGRFIIMPYCVGLNTFMSHLYDIYLDVYLFAFWVTMSATIRLQRPGLGWSMASYAPLMALIFILISFATRMIRGEILKVLMPFVFIIIAVWAVITLAIGFKRILKADYATVFGCMGLIAVSAVLVFAGYYYPAYILVLFCASIIMYISALVCLKHFINKYIKRKGNILHLTICYLIYPYIYIYILVCSAYNVANIFNLNTWLDTQLSSPFIGIPQFGIISVSRILSVIVIGILVNYIIKLIKQILMNIDKSKYETGSYAVAITLGTMLIWVGYVIVVLFVFQINHSGVIAAIGGASVGIGFAMKETLENLISGLQLMASRARPGDLIECDNVRGFIKRVDVLSTQIEIEDGPIVSFPNRQLLSNRFTNLTLNHHKEIRHIIFDISADSNLELAKRLMLESSKGIHGVVDYDKHYVVMCNTNSGIVRLDYKCWVDSALYLQAEPAVREAIFRAFRANGIQIADFSNELGLHITDKLTEKQ